MSIATSSSQATKEMDMDCPVKFEFFVPVRHGNEPATELQVTVFVDRKTGGCRVYTQSSGDSIASYAYLTPQIRQKLDGLLSGDLRCLNLYDDSRPAHREVTGLSTARTRDARRMFCEVSDSPGPALAPLLPMTVLENVLSHPSLRATCG